MTYSWDPAAYLAFDDLRARPFHDLLARVGARRARRVVDLGCGPGHLTGVLGARWPDAEVVALDSSQDMVAAARARGVPARVLDVRDWHPGPSDDVVVCNAVLHWVSGHRRLLGDWLAAMPAGGWLAVQVPGNHASPSHTLIAEAAARWGITLGEGNRIDEPAEYATTLAGAGADADVWETTYLHRLTGADPVLGWVSGSALRPVRDTLDDAGWEAFRVELAPRLRVAYPPGPDGVTWFPFRRVFAVAHRPA